MKENPIDCGYLKIPIHLSDAHYNNCVFYRYYRLEKFVA